MRHASRCRAYLGRPPHNGVLVAVFSGFPCPLPGGQSETWHLYLREQASSPVWLSFKLCAVGVAALKGNYWLGWGMREKRFNRFADSARLHSGRPELCTAVVRTIEELVAKLANPLLRPPYFEPLICTPCPR